MDWKDMPVHNGKTGEQILEELKQVGMAAFDYLQKEYDPLVEIVINNDGIFLKGTYAWLSSKTIATER